MGFDFDIFGKEAKLKNFWGSEIMKYTNLEAEKTPVLKIYVDMIICEKIEIFWEISDRTCFDCDLTDKRTCYYVSG